MRIGSGEFRGRKLHAPKGSETRPTGARLKKSLFDVLAPVLGGARVLDLYAGAGALGLEALSRGADRAVFVERARKAADSILRNIKQLGLDERAELLKLDVRLALANLQHGGGFDVVFADPPYATEELDRSLASLAAGELIAADGLVVVEHHHKRELQQTYGELEQFRVLKSGESCFTLYRRVC